MYFNDRKYATLINSQNKGSKTWSRVLTIVDALAEEEDHDEYPRSRFEANSPSTVVGDSVIDSIEYDRDDSPDTEEGDMDDMEMVDASTHHAVGKTQQAGDEDMEIEIDTNESAEVVSYLQELHDSC